MEKLLIISEERTPDSIIKPGLSNYMSGATTNGDDKNIYKLTKIVCEHVSGDVNTTIPIVMGLSTFIPDAPLFEFEIYSKLEETKTYVKLSSVQYAIEITNDGRGLNLKIPNIEGSGLDDVTVVITLYRE